MIGGATNNDMRLSIAHEKTVGLIFMIIMSAGLLVNMAVIVVFVWKKKYRISHHLAYLNLAVSDTVMALFAVSIRGPAIYMDSTSALECEITTIAAVYITMTNFASIVPLTYDRLVAVFSPFRYKDSRHVRTLKASFIAIWGAPVAILALTLLIIRIRHGVVPFAAFDNTTKDCSMNDEWNADFFLNYFIAGVFYIAPLIFNVVSYAMIIWRLSRRKNIRLTMLSIRSFLVCLFFTVCWVPIFAFHMANVSTGHMWLAQIFMYTNALIDPLLYAFSLKALKPCLKRFYPPKTSPVSKIRSTKNTLVFMRDTTTPC
eukprot:sb/3467000/